MGLYLIGKLVPRPWQQSLLKKAHLYASRQIIATLIQLKGLYIKIGQTLSIMTNFLPADLTAGLELLQDDVPAHPYSEVEKRFLADFKKSPRELFKEFDEIPLASASLAQVHRAELHTGEIVAIKFQYPNIDTLVKKDLKTIRRIFNLIDFFFPSYGFSEIYKECEAMILRELDFTQEAEAISKMAKNFADVPSFYFTKTYPEYSTSRILTLEYIDGIKMSDLASLQNAGINQHDLAVTFIHGACKQIFTDGFYHADPHPGNLLVVPSKNPNDAVPYKIVLLDFGATGHLTPAIREGLTHFIEGLIAKDTKLLSNAMKEMGFIAREDSEETFQKVVDYFYEKIRSVQVEDFSKLNIGDFQHLNDLFELKKMDISLKELTTLFHVPREWILLERALLLTMGLVARLDPQMNPVDIVVPYVEKNILGGEKTIATMMMQSTKEMLNTSVHLPAQLARLIKKIEDGKITITDKSREKSAMMIARMIRHLSLTFLLIFLFLLFPSVHNYFSEGVEIYRKVLMALGALWLWGYIRWKK